MARTRVSVCAARLWPSQGLQGHSLPRCRPGHSSPTPFLGPGGSLLPVVQRGHRGPELALHTQGACRPGGQRCPPGWGSA